MRYEWLNAWNISVEIIYVVAGICNYLQDFSSREQLFHGMEYLTDCVTHDSSPLPRGLYT